MLASTDTACALQPLTVMLLISRHDASTHESVVTTVAGSRDRSRRLLLIASLNLVPSSLISVTLSVNSLDSHKTQTSRLLRGDRHTASLNVWNGGCLGVVQLERTCKGTPMHYLLAVALPFPDISLFCEPMTLMRSASATHRYGASLG